VVLVSQNQWRQQTKVCNEGLKKLLETSQQDNKLIERPQQRNSKIVEHAQIPFPNGYNYCEWCAKIEQFFYHEMTLNYQCGKLLLLSMEGKAFMWQ